jgi:hypothetical protein
MTDPKLMRVIDAAIEWCNCIGDAEFDAAEQELRAAIMAYAEAQKK